MEQHRNLKEGVWNKTSDEKINTAATRETSQNAFAESEKKHKHIPGMVK
jgi:hypothetical protein